MPRQFETDVIIKQTKKSETFKVREAIVKALSVIGKVERRFMSNHGDSFRLVITPTKQCNRVQIDAIIEQTISSDIVEYFYTGLV